MNRPADRGLRWFVAAAAAALTAFAPGAFAGPAFQAAGGAQSGTGAVSVAWPAHAAGDIALLFVETAGGEPATLSSPAGFVAVANSPQATGAGTAGTQITVFWARATSTTMASPTVADAGNHVYAQILTYRGAIASGNPWDVSGGGVKAAASASVTVTGVTTTVADTLIVQAVARDINSTGAVFSAQTNSNLLAIAERSDTGTGSGNGGGFAVWDGRKMAPGATGDTTATVTSSINAFLTVALKPPAAPVITSAADQSFNVGDPSHSIADVTVIDNPSSPVVTAANDLRIRIPASFNATWDTSVTAVSVTGGAAGKVSGTLSAYEASNKVAVINVTANFAAGDVLVISGLRLANFTGTSAADNLELVVAGAGGATADTDDKTVAIVNNNVSSAGSRIMNDNASRTPVAGEDVDVVNWIKTTPFLVTIGIQTAASGGADCRGDHGANKLQWRNVTDNGAWTALGTTAGPEMVLFNSANLLQGNNVTAAEAQITGNGSFISGEEVESNTSVNWGNRARNGDHTAVQFPIDPSGGIDGKTYQFRFIVDQLCSVTAGTNVASVNVTLASAGVTPGAFNAFETSTAANAIAGQVHTKRSGVNFALDVVAIASGAQLASFSSTVHVDLVTGASGGADCPGTPVSVAGAQAVSINSGRGTTGSFSITSAHPDVRVRIRYPTVASPTVTSCSTDNFAIRPSGITVSSSASNNGTSGAPTLKTGANFSLTATTGVVGYNGTPAIDNSQVVGSPNAGTLGGSFSAADALTGTATGSTFFYDEVGNFGLNANAVRDTSFTAVDQPGDCTADYSNTLSVDGKYGCYFGSAAIAMNPGTSGFGRFIPDNFDVAFNTPTFATFCSSFTYLGQSLPYATAPQMTVTARSGTANGLTNTTTRNYAGAYAKLSTASLNQAPYNTQAARYGRFDALGGGATPALDTAPLPATASDPTLSTAFTNGVGVFTFASGVAFQRPSAAPVAEFDADISLALNIVDDEGVAYASNPKTVGTATTGGGIGFTGAKTMRFGRLNLDNAVGAVSMPLPIRMETQYWVSTALEFQRNTADNCTSVQQQHLTLGSYTGSLNACETALGPAGVTFASGVATVNLAAPGTGNDGTVQLTLNLGAASGNYCASVGGAQPAATSAAMSYLLGRWTGATWTENPSARAAFGLYGVQPARNFIYFRENY